MNPRPSFKVTAFLFHLTSLAPPTQVFPSKCYVEITYVISGIKMRDLSLIRETGVSTVPFFAYQDDKNQILITEMGTVGGRINRYSACFGVSIIL